MLWQGKNKFNHIEVAPGGASYGFGTYNTMGKVYFVNNITGSSTADGDTWDRAMAEPSQAITAILARQAAAANGNEYIRNTVVIQGTSTAYAALTSLAGYTDYIGIGADPSGNGGGIARIDGAGTADAIDTGSSTVRGFNLYNLQLMQSADGAVYGLDIAGAAYRFRIEHCGFANNGTAGIHAKSCGSLVMDDCKIIQDQFWTDYGMLVGSTSASTGNFNAVTITDSFFTGTTAGFMNYNNSCGGTVIKDSVAIGGTNGFVDLSNDANGVPHMLKFVSCYAFGTDSTTINAGGFEITNNYTKKAINCMANDNGTLHIYPAVVGYS